MIEMLLDKRLQKAELAIARQYAQLLNKIRHELGLIYEKYEVNGQLTYVEMAKYDRLKKFLSNVNSLMGTAYKDLKKTFDEVLSETYFDGYYLTGWAIETDTLSRLNYSVVKSDVILAMIENPISGLALSERLEKSRANIIYTIQQEITQGLVKGETYKTMANRIKGVLENDTVKSMRIVRTESHRVKESSKYDSALHSHKNGVLMNKTWKSMKDERVRPGRGIGKKPAKSGADHRMLDGKKLVINQDFVGVVGKGKAPGQMGTASEDINCRCLLAYSVEKIQKPNANNLGDMPFETWKKERLNPRKEVVLV